VALTVDNVSLLFWLNPKYVARAANGAATEKTNRYFRMVFRSNFSANKNVTSPKDAERKIKSIDSEMN